jgi:hypothetical protein
VVVCFEIVISISPRRPYLTPEINTRNLTTGRIDIVVTMSILPVVKFLVVLLL